ncbi:MAG: hypothetical protein ACI4MT_01560 [Christensenellales bacterium]
MWRETLTTRDKSEVVKCTACGADMVFDIASGRLVCPYCGNANAVESKATPSRDYFTFKNEGAVSFEGIVVRCPNCDSEMEIADFSTATNCPFCGASNVQKTDTLPGLKPDSLLPFKVTKEEAIEIAKKTVKKKFFAPGKLKKSFNAEHFNGLYTPVFLFDAGSKSSYNGRLGEYYYVTVGTGENKRTERRVRYINISGNYERNFNNVAVEASSNINQAELNKLMPFDYDNQVAYDSKYVAGMQAERYNTSLEESFSVAKNGMDGIIKQEILAKYKYDFVDYINIDSLYKPVRFRYSFVPLWICAYKYRKKNYRLFVNARTGKSYGKFPKSFFKILFLILLGLGIVGALIYLFVFSGVV